MPQVVSVPSPLEGLYRIARVPAEPFALPDWNYAGPDGTFGNRFDDPGELLGIPREHQYRVLYCATQREAAFGEITSRFRVRPGFVELLNTIDDDEESITDALRGAVDPDYPEHGLLDTDWIQRRRIGHTRIGDDARFVDIGHSETLAHLNEHIGVLAARLGIGEIDLSAITSSSRRLTQYASRYIYERGFSGIRYTSRLGDNWECWALFENRFHHQMGYPGFASSLSADDDDLFRVARKFGLTIEVIRGMGHYIRPWQEPLSP